jgi:hypothetical protein
MTEEQRRLNAMTPEKRRVRFTKDCLCPMTGEVDDGTIYPGVRLTDAEKRFADLKEADEAAGERRGRVAELRDVLTQTAGQQYVSRDWLLARLAELKEDTP